MVAAMRPDLVERAARDLAADDRKRLEAARRADREAAVLPSLFGDGDGDGIAMVRGSGDEKA